MSTVIEAIFSSIFSWFQGHQPLHSHLWPPIVKTRQILFCEMLKTRLYVVKALHDPILPKVLEFKLRMRLLLKKPYAHAFCAREHSAGQTCAKRGESFGT